MASRTGSRGDGRNHRAVPGGRLLAVVAVVAASVAGFVVAARDDGGSGGGTTATSAPERGLAEREGAERRAAEAWEAASRAAFSELVEGLPSLLETVDRWQRGEIGDAEAREEVARRAEGLVRVRDAVAELPVFEPAPEAGRHHRRAAVLFVEMARVLRVAVDVEDAALRRELVALAERVRVLGDRVFDRGQALVAPFRHEEPLEGVEVRSPEEVPDWAHEGKAPGPPLEPEAPPPAGEPRFREERRPEQDREGWLAAFEAAGIPAADELAAAVDGDDPLRLRDLARAFVAAAEELRHEPDPRDGREESAVARLGLLVAAEAARAAQAGLLAGGGPEDDLRAVARRLALVADELWPSGAPPRRSGFDPPLLDDPA